MRARFSQLVFIVLVLCACDVIVAQQLNQNCVVSVLNRTVQVNADGSWVLPNVPANFGPVRARATCVNNGITTFGQSDFFTLPANGTINLPHIQIGNISPIPTGITLTATTTTLTQAGATTQLTVTATYAGAPNQNITAASTGTQYSVSNTAIATVSANGLVSAVSSGTVVIQAVNEGAQGLINIQVAIAGASHGGIPDSWAIANGLDPTDPTLAAEDPDHDGLTNLQEFQLGTDPRKADTDGDGLTDGQEALIYHTNPLAADSDGDGIPDGIEVKNGSDPLNPASFNLNKALLSLEVKPSSFVLTVNSIEGLASQQLSVLGHLIDGKTTLDLTSTQKGTNYSSSNLNICNFGSPDGNIFAGSNGPCTITITNSGFTAQATAVINSFTPTALSFVAVPGFANGVAVNGNYAYVAAGSAGLQVVNVGNRNQPQIVASLSLPGNANGIRLLGSLAYIAGGSAGLHAVDITNPLAPVLRGTLSTGNALGVAVRGSTAYVANGSNLVLVNVTNPAALTQISALALNGTIQGVDVDSQRKLAVAAAGTAGLHVIDLSNPAAPVLRGTAVTGDARAAAIGGNYAFVADFQNSTTSVDITVPSAPIARSRITDPNLGGFLLDIVLSGHFALAADVKFVNGVPITDIANPASLIARSILNFPQRDDNGMGIAADGSYVYLTTEHGNLDKFGSSGDSRLYIGQYLALVDNKGVPPTASITSPITGGATIQGSTLPITVNATDDVGVASVNFLVNGQVVFTATSAPYQFNFTVPTGISSLTLGATAVDLGGNIGTATNVVLSVLPDPLTTVTGRVVDSNNQAVPGAIVTVFDTFTGSTGNDGSFSISGVPTVRGSIVARATVTIGGVPLAGSSAAFAPVALGSTNVGTIVVSGLGSAIVVSRDSNSIHIIDVTKRTITATVNLGSDAIDVAVTPDGRTAAVTSFSSRVVTFLDLTTSPPHVLGTVGTPISAEDVEISSTGAFAVVADGGGSTSIFSINVATRQIVSTLSLPVAAEGITVTPSGQVLINSFDSNQVRLINMGANGSLTDTGVSFAINSPLNLTVSPNGQIGLVASVNSNSIGVLHIGNGTITSAGTIASFAAPQSIAFTPDGRRAYVLLSGGQVGVLNIDAAGNVTDSGVRIANTGAAPTYFGVDQIAVTPGGNQVLVHGQGVVTFINVATNTILGSIPLPNDGSAGGIAIIH